MTCEILKLFIFDKILTIIYWNISILSSIFSWIVSLFILSLPHLSCIKRIFMLFLFLFKLICKLCSSCHGECISSGGNIASGQDRLVLSLYFILIEFTYGLILIIFGDFFGFVFNIHGIVYFSTVVIEDILLIQFCWLRLNISLIVVVRYLFSNFLWLFFDGNVANGFIIIDSIEMSWNFFNGS